MNAHTLTVCCSLPPNPHVSVICYIVVMRYALTDGIFFVYILFVGGLNSILYYVYKEVDEWHMRVFYADILFVHLVLRL